MDWNDENGPVVLVALVLGAILTLLWWKFQDAAMDLLFRTLFRRDEGGDRDRPDSEDTDAFVTDTTQPDEDEPDEDAGTQENGGQDWTPETMASQEATDGVMDWSRLWLFIAAIVGVLYVVAHFILKYW